MADQPRATLVVEQGVGGETEIPLDRAVCLVGSATESDIVVDNPYVSRLHARIVLTDQHFEIRDLGSKNGTFVNGAQLGQAGHVLHTGDRIELARGQVIFRFRESGGTLTLQTDEVADKGDVAVDAGSRDVWVLGTKMDPPLSRKEFDVLLLLYQKRGQACSRDEIATAGWPERPEADVGDQEIDQYVRRLRRRIEPNPSQPRYLITVRRFGYKLS